MLRVVGQFPARDGTLVVSGFEPEGHPIVRRLQFFELFELFELFEVIGDNGRLRSKRILPVAFEFVDKD